MGVVGRGVRGSAANRSGGNGAQASTTRKSRQPFASRKGLDELEMKTNENDTRTRANGSVDAARDLLRGGKRRTNKKALGVGVTP